MVEIKITDDATAPTTGDGKAIFTCPRSLSGLTLNEANGFVTTFGATAITINMRNLDQSSADMLRTAITIDASEYTSYTAATPPVIGTTGTTIVTGDRIAVDLDAVNTTCKGIGVILGFG